MADTTDLKKGVAIKRENKLYFVTDVFFVSPGKGSAFYRTKIKEMSTGKLIEITLKSGEGVELIDTERRNIEFLYKNGDRFVFMDDESFEQHEFDNTVIDDNTAQFLKENQKLILLVAEGNPLSVTFPKQKVVFKVVEAPPGIKGDTVTNATKEAVLETGAKIQVPLFINAGDLVVVNVELGEYYERAKDYN